MFAYDCTMKVTIIRIILWVLVLGWIAVLFSLSAQPADVSGKMSGDILENIYDNTGEKVIDKERFDKDLFVRANQGRIRRIAHLSMFSVLGILTAAASLYSLGKTVKGLVTALVITVSYSFIDELVQLVTPGRSFEWGDLVRDLLGSFIGILLIYLIFFITKRIRVK